MTAEDKLADLLVHYFRLAWEGAGLHWDSANRAEVEEMAALVVQIARAEA